MKFVLQFNMDNEAFQGDALHWELFRILYRLARRYEACVLDNAERPSTIQDSNGNTIGEARIEE